MMEDPSRRYGYDWRGYRSIVTILIEIEIEIEMDGGVQPARIKRRRSCERLLLLLFRLPTSRAPKNEVRSLFLFIYSGVDVRRRTRISLVVELEADFLKGLPAVPG